MRKRLLYLALLVLGVAILYLSVGVDFTQERIWKYALQIRTPKVLAILLSAYAVANATMIFQTIVQNRIITPNLLGMNSLYTLIHTLVAFLFGASSALANNIELMFFIDLVAMGLVATLIYSYFFKKTSYNILYILLIGTVLSSFFGSFQSYMIRVMDPDEYESLLNSLVAGFSHMRYELLLVAFILLIALRLIFRKDFEVLDVMAMGRSKAINLGVDYDKSLRRLLMIVSLYIAISTALVGPISFIGLLVVNIARYLFKTYKHSYLIPASVLIGIIMLLGGELLVERVFSYSVPVSVFVNLFGGLYFLYLLLRRKAQ